MKTQDGFILIIVLVFLQLISLLTLYSLESAKLTAKTTEKLSARHEVINHLKNNLQAIEENFSENCLIPNLSEDELSSKPLSWWQKQTCTGNFQSIQYYYVVESLGEDSCAHVVRNKGMTADYYRITLRGSALNDEIQVLMQSTMIKPNPALHVCDKVMHTVKLGRQSLRVFFNQKIKDDEK